MLHVSRLILCTVLGLSLGSGSVFAQDMADTIYSGGSVLTMEDDLPRAEAVAVRDGRILAVGTNAEIAAYRDSGTRMFDLRGQTMIPGFVDSHGHVIGGGLQAVAANLLSPPDGGVTDHDSLVETLRSWAADNQAIIDAAGFIVGFGYDQAQLSELAPPTKDMLDLVSTEVPVIIFHQSGHFGVMNSKGLEVAGITRNSPNPPGGVIMRDADGMPTGVLEENAFFASAVPLIAGMGTEGFVELARAGSELWASYGYTTGQEGRATAPFLEAAHLAAERGMIPIDMVIYPDVLEARDLILPNLSGTYVNHVRVGGAKLTIDGSPQGFTALRDRPYYDPVGDYEPGYKGYAAADMDQVLDAVDWSFANDVQILTHANGEGASDMLIAAIRAAEAKHGPGDRRPVLIHGQFLRPDQVDAVKELAIFPSVFPMHTYYWGDWHRDHTVGPVDADNISPTGWLVQRGMKFGTHHDAPVAFPDSMRVLDATVTRRTRSEDILGPAQRVDVMTALKAMTIWPAWQHFEEDSKGSIAVGKLADLVILSDDPLTAPADELSELRVMVTIKEDKVIYEAQDRDGDGAVTGAGFGGDFEPGTALGTGYELMHAIESAVGSQSR